MKKILALSLALLMVLALAACSGKTDPAPSGSGTTDPGTAQQQPSDAPDDSGVAWPSNTYIDMLPKPENIVIYEEEEIDNAYYLGHRVTFEKWKIDDCRAYAQKLQELGWTVPGTGMDAVIIKDTADDFEFGASNQDGVYVGISAHAANNSGGISIYNLKQDLEEN